MEKVDSLFSVIIYIITLHDTRSHVSAGSKDMREIVKVIGEMNPIDYENQSGD